MLVVFCIHEILVRHVVNEIKPKLEHKFHSLIICGCLLLFTSMLLKCDYGSDGYSTQSKLGGGTCKHYPVMCRSIFLCNVVCKVGWCLHAKYMVYKHLNTSSC